MKKDKILFIRYKEDGTEQKAKQSRKKVINTFEKLAEENPDNNVISTRLLKILPEISRIIIPREDLNRKNPYILCKIKNKTIMFEIPRCHKICWKELKKFTEK